MAIKIVIADDHEVVRRGLTSLLAGSEIKIVGEATTGVEAFAEALRAALRDMAALAEAAESTGGAAAAAAATPRL